LSIAALHPKTPLEGSGYAARLIPGQRALNAVTRKHPQSLRSDGTLKDAASTRETTSAFLSSVAKLVLPRPIVASDVRHFWSILLTDYALICASWSAVALVESLLREASGQFFSGTPFLRAVGTGLLFGEIATLMGYSEGLYRRNREFWPQSAILFKSLGWTTLLLGAGFYLSGFSTPSFTWLACSAALSGATLLAWRRWQESAQFRVAGFAKHTHNVLIVDAGPTGRQVADYFDRHPELGRVVRGFLDESSAPSFGVLGPPHRLASIARAEFIDEVILAAPQGSDLARYIIQEARNNRLDVRAVPNFYGCELSQLRVETLGTISLVTLHEEKLPDAGLFLKRVLDVVLSAIALFLTAPAMLLVACLIKLDSHGPVFYSAPRVGRKGKRFRCYKFRTMKVNAEQCKDKLRARNQREGPCFKITQDPRITRVGSWIRRFSLDELPQLWNVFRGEMSLVGPRPHPLDDFARYQLEHFRRLDVMPGITGLWQVTARQNPSFATNMKLDLEYIDNWSIWLDLRILFKTITVVFQGTGA
jgi:exopolysaccharide biosynthesis polyprenyl glycosylphosphotransferase